MSDDDQPGSVDRLWSQVAVFRHASGAPTEDAGTSCFAVLARSLGGGHAGTGGWIWQRDEDGIDRSGLLTM